MESGALESLSLSVCREWQRLVDGNCTAALEAPEESVKKVGKSAPAENGIMKIQLTGI